MSRATADSRTPVPGPEATLGDASDGVGPDQEPSRGAAIIAYVLVALVPIGLVLGPLGTLVLWRLRRDEPFVDHHARQALDVFLTALLVGGGLVVLARALEVVVLEWAGFAVVGLQFLLAVAGATMAGRGNARDLPLVLPLLGRWSGREANRQGF